MSLTFREAQLGHALLQAQALILEIRTGRKVSIGSINNTYMPQLSVKRVDELGELVDHALAWEDKDDSDN